jgi:hypothetical protein
MAGFAPHILREVMIQISEVRRISVKLEVQGAREVVEVKSPLLQTEGAALGRVIDGATIVALPLSSRVNQFFDTSAFVPATLMHAGGLIDGQFPVAGDGTIFGSLGRNILRGPDQHNVDAALIKHTKLTEKVGIVFRWEVFNILNHPNFANPTSNVSSPSTFGKISAMSVNPRIMQYGLKLEL